MRRCAVQRCIPTIDAAQGDSIGSHRSSFCRCSGTRADDSHVGMDECILTVGHGHQFTLTRTVDGAHVLDARDCKRCAMRGS
jgi:hypothetical protein